MEIKIGQLWKKNRVIEILDSDPDEANRNPNIAPRALVVDIKHPDSPFYLYHTKIFVTYDHISGPKP